MPDAQGKLTREEMEAVIDRGESVIYNGHHIKSKSQLPSAIDLAISSVDGGDTDVAADTEEDIDAQIAGLQEQKKRVEAARKDAKSKAKVAADEKAAADKAAADKAAKGDEGQK